MNEPIIPPAPRESLLRHRRERNLQILLPAILAVVIIIAAAVLIVIGAIEGGDAARWAAISTICLTVPIMFTSLIVLAILSATIYGAAKVYSQTPTYSGKAIEVVETVAVRAKHYADVISEPLLRVKTWLGVPEKFIKK